MKMRKGIRRPTPIPISATMTSAHTMAPEISLPTITRSPVRSRSFSDGSSKLETIPLSEQIFPVSMQWDGAYLAIVDRRGVPRGPTPVARVQVTASGGEIVSTTQLRSPHGRRASTGVQYFVDGGTIVGPDRYRHAGDRLALLFWHYPSGGKPFKVIRGTWSAGGDVVSAAPK